MLWFALEAISASAFPQYSYLRNYISDLGNPAREVFDGRVVESRLAWLMNVDFVAHGGAFFAGACFAFRAAGRGAGRYLFVVLVALNAIGSVLVAAVHSNNAAAHDGTEALHGLGALLSIVAGNLAILTAATCANRVGGSRLYRALSAIGGVAGIACLALLVRLPAGSPIAGLFERGSVYPIMLWEIATAAAIFVSARRRNGIGGVRASVH